MEINSQFWQKIKDSLISKNYDNKILKTWIDPIEYVSFNKSDSDERMILAVPSKIQQYFANENLHDKICAEISSIYNKQVYVDIIVSQIHSENTVSNEMEVESETLKSQLSRNQMPQTSTALFQKKEYSKVQDILNPDFTFSSFVVGKNSEFAHAACYNVARNPGLGDYNPLYIYGPVGMGKTHLLHAAGNYIKQTLPHLKVTYISAENFLNECISSIRRHEMDKFRQKYRESSDIFLVDDVQYIARGEAVQEEFFHTVNAFIDQKKQVILASDRMPKDIHGLEDRSRTRLERGLIADIAMPDLETRVAILKYKAELYGLPLPDEVVLYIAKISKRSIRELEGNLKKVKIYSELQGLSISYDLVKKILSNHETNSTISVDEILKIISDFYKVRLNDIKSSTRVKSVVIPRQIAMFMIKKFMDRSLVDIGKIFGGRDHTTVLNALSRVKSLQANDQDFSKDLEELETRIHNITGV